jgi:hypothetical protein
MQQLILKNINVRQLGFERTTNRYKPKGTLSNNWRYLIQKRDSLNGQFVKQDYKWWNEDKRQLTFNL